MKLGFSALPAAVLLNVCSLAAQPVQITAGAVDDQVFQRSTDNKADVPLSGTAPSGKSIEARVTRKHMPVAGFDWKAIATSEQGKWKGAVAGLPVGGPYRIEVRTAGSTEIRAVSNVLVGDLWILAGQSNMEGVGDLVHLQPPHELVHNFDLADQWMAAEEPLHSLPSAADRVHWRLDEQKQPERYTGEKLAKYVAERKKGAGLGLPFAVQMVNRTGIPIGLLSCAHGGTSMEQWSPSKKDLGGDSLYGSMYRRVMAAGGKARGVLWYQGESDANPTALPVFQDKFEKLVAAIRTDLNLPDLPFYYVQIGRHLDRSNLNEWNGVQDAQRLAEMRIPRAAMAAAVDLDLDDGIHVGTQDLKRLAARLANLAIHDLFPSAHDSASIRKGPRPVSAVFSQGVVRVSFSDVNGRLESSGRISGFSIHNADGAAVPMIYKARVDPADGSAILLSISGVLPAGATLRYGAGKDPYCNVRDGRDMAVPVFGPLSISSN